MIRILYFCNTLHQLINRLRIPKKVKGHDQVENYSGKTFKYLMKSNANKIKKILNKWSTLAFCNNFCQFDAAAVRFDPCLQSL